MLKIGISEVDITPAPGLRMAGMVNPPKAEGVHFPLKARYEWYNTTIEGREKSWAVGSTPSS